MIQYNKYNITFTQQSETDKIDLDKIILKYQLQDKDIPYQFERIRKRISKLTRLQQEAVIYLFNHIYRKDQFPFFYY